MKKYIFSSIFILNLSATEYVSQINPYEIHKVASDVAGKVTFVDKSLEFRDVGESKRIVKLDSQSEAIELDALNDRVEFLKRTVSIKENQFKSKRDIQRMSEYEKLSEEYLYLKERDNYRMLLQNIELLKNTIDKKSIDVKNRYIGKIYVNEGNFVTAGTILFDSYDTSKLAIEVYVREEEIKNIKSKKVYVDGIESDFKIESLSKIKDNTNISTYYVKLVKPNSDKNYLFSKIVSIEFKE